MNNSLFTDPLFSVRNSQRARESVSLLDIVQRNDVMAFDYPIAMMNVFARFLATGLLEAALSNTRIRFDKKTWNQLVEGQQWPESVFDALNNPPDGLDLMGDVAFMQMPNEIFADKEMKPIDQLLQPFIVSGETTKGLRQDGEKIRQLCCCCALIGLYTQHFHTAAISQYWSTSSANGAQLFSPVAIGQPLRATLATHLLSKPMYERELNNKHIGKDEFQTMPWVPKNKRINLEQKQILPFEQWLNPEQQRGNLSDAWLPLIRALRLNNRTAQSPCYCDCCANKIATEESVIDGFYLKTEADVFKLLDEKTQAAYQKNTVAYEAQFASKNEPGDQKEKTTKVFNFKRLYKQQLRHPLLAYKPNKQSEDKERVLAPAFQNNLNSRRPNWADLLKAKDKNQPVLLKQLGYRTNINAADGVDLIGLGYKKGRDIDCLTHQFFSLSLFAPVLHLSQDCSNESFLEPLQKNSQTVFSFFDQIINQEKDQENQQSVEQAYQAIEQQKTELKSTSDELFQKQQLIDTIEGFEQEVQQLQTLSRDNSDELKKSKQSVKKMATLQKAFMNQHAHYAKAHISHTEQVINALLESGKVLEKKVEPDYQKKSFKIKTERRPDNRLTRAPQFMNMVSTLWQSTLHNLIEISAKQSSEERENCLFQSKQALTQQGNSLLMDYLNVNPLISTELAGRFLENKALAEYRKRTKVTS